MRWLNFLVAATTWEVNLRFWLISRHFIDFMLPGEIKYRSYCRVDCIFAVFFATKASGIKEYLGRTNKTRTFIGSTEDLSGVAWDEKNQQLYYCSSDNIYRASGDGTSVKSVFNSRDGEFASLKFCRFYLKKSKINLWHVKTRFILQTEVWPPCH